MVEVGEGREVVGMVGRKDMDGRVGVVTIDGRGTLKGFFIIDDKFRIVAQMDTQQVLRICAKVTSDLDKPSFMICFKDANLPILLSLN
jgi:hypothetical protein